ncbi:maestro heat-like repeat-containing protein family member 7 [Phalacrocorax aristotelis]|uniref:maestro heat-like repeat-containing protein family member 7 n=1 Tax=Phalacrocorax aristotelis TaxID=126867 RepID=UPI003F4B5FE2
MSSGGDAATPQRPDDATGQDGVGLRGAPEQPPRSLLNRTCDAFPTCLPPLRPQPSRPGLSSMAERPPSVPRLAWLAGGEEEEDKDRDLPEEEQEQQQEQEPTCVLKPTEPEDTTITAIEGMAGSGSYDAEACAAMQALLAESDVSSLEHPCLLQVPSVVRCIYRWLTSNTDVSATQRLPNALAELTHAHPHDVVVTLLRCAPSCDRAAAAMWRVMVSTMRTADKVLLELLPVLADWPLHSTFTSDGDNKDVFALAATRALWEILRLPGCPRRLQVHFPCLFLALLSQIFFSTEQMPEEVDTFWRGCQQEGCLPTNPNSFAVLTVKALLCRLGYENVVFEVERKRGWDTLLNAETHHYAMGLLAREMRGISRCLRYCIARYLVEQLNRKEPRWEVPAMALFLELLTACPDIRGWGVHILQFSPRYLRSECREMHRLVLRCFILLIDRPLMDASYVQLLSIRLFRDVMEFVVESGEKPLRAHIYQSLIPLLCRLHDENERMAEASRETLLQATEFLNKGKLRQLLEMEQTWAVAECLLAEHSSRADEYLRQSLLYLQSPQESVREAAVRFIALQGMTNDVSISVSNLAAQTLFLLRGTERNSSTSFRLLGMYDHLRSAWRRRPSLRGSGWLCCWSSAQS